ncbi:MAG: YitT family protein [Treponema sp.]|uniref:YitT family protein n=1 Tax=Treponema sp. TaxID=166 RepID=UPI00298DE407|nr:YitT family protein [Treponema sp.]MCQ2602083.1 YitT family protein [Treponema sp.]
MMKKEIKRLILIVSGAVLMALNINTFVHSADLIPGGFSGVALLIQNVAKKYFGLTLPFSILVYILNIFPIYIGFRYIGKKFTLYSMLMIIVSGFLTDVIPGFKITDDILLSSIFGGICNAIAINCCLMADSSSGGTDFISIYVSEKTGKSAWNYIMAGNFCILLIAGILINWNAALYSIIFQYVSTQVLNLLYKRYEKITLLVVTDKPDELYRIIKEQTNHDATVFNGKGCYQGTEHALLYSVVSGSESGNLEKLIRLADPDAFINVIRSKSIVGRFFKRNLD